VTGSKSALWTGFIPGTFSTLTPVGPPITVTLNPNFAFKTSVPTTVLSFPNQTAPVNVSFSADSLVATLTVGPNVNSALLATGITFKGQPRFVYSVPSSAKVVSTVILNFAATLTPPSPLGGGSTVITATGTETFSATAAVTWPSGAAPILLSRTATTLTVVPNPASTGAPTVSGVIAASAPLFSLTLPAVVPTGLTVGAGSIYTSSSPAAATPNVAAPGFYDRSPLTAPCAATGNAGGATCQYYKLVVAAAGPKAFNFTWDSADDLGLYFMDSAFNGIAGSCDAGGNGATGHPENCTITFPAAGTYYLEVADYGPFYPAGTAPKPNWIQATFN
jgi:hypothetical protein